MVRRVMGAGRVVHPFGAAFAEDVGAAGAYNQAQPN